MHRTPGQDVFNWKIVFEIINFLFVQAHVHPVCSLSWSRSGKKMVSASTDNTVCIWDVLTGECDHRFRYKFSFNPNNKIYIEAKTEFLWELLFTLSCVVRDFWLTTIGLQCFWITTYSKNFGDLSLFTSSKKICDLQDTGHP